MPTRRCWPRDATATELGQGLVSVGAPQESARICRGADGPDRRVWHQCLSRLRAEKHRTRGVAARRGSNLLIAVRDFGVLAIIASLLLQALTSPGDLNRDETRGRREL